MGGMKKNGFKGGRESGNIGFKGGGSPIKFPKFCSDGICNNANSLPESQKPAFLTFRKFRFSRVSLDVLLYFTKSGC